VHGVKGRGKLTVYGLQLREKQKARWIYGVLERQFRRYYETALKKPGATDAVLLQLLEARLDNIVYRMGISKTRAGARQIINHGHMQVDGHKVDISSYTVRPGQVVSVDPQSLTKPYFVALAKIWGKQPVELDWLAVHQKEFKARLVNLPTPEQVKQPFDMKLIVEFYSR
jgi:small subunit ribosomal protein S4